MEFKFVNYTLFINKNIKDRGPNFKLLLSQF